MICLSLAAIPFLPVFATRRRRGQTAVLADAWWTYQQDAMGTAAKAGTLFGDRAR